MLTYSHLITVEEKDGSRVIRIDRVFEGGKKDFCTEIEPPPHDEKKKWDLFDQLACSLGKSICIDSVGVREHLKQDQKKLLARKRQRVLEDRTIVMIDHSTAGTIFTEIGKRTVHWVGETVRLPKQSWCSPSYPQLMPDADGNNVRPIEWGAIQKDESNQAEK